MLSPQTLKSLWSFLRFRREMGPIEGLIRAFSRDLSTEFSNSVDIFSFFREIPCRATPPGVGASAPLRVGATLAVVPSPTMNGGGPLRHDHQKDQVKISTALRGAKRRGNLLVLRTVSGIFPGDSHGAAPLGMTDGRIVRIRRGVCRKLVPTACPPSVMEPCFAWLHDSSPTLTRRGALGAAAPEELLSRHYTLVSYD